MSRPLIAFTLPLVLSGCSFLQKDDDDDDDDGDGGAFPDDTGVDADGGTGDGGGDGGGGDGGGDGDGGSDGGGTAPPLTMDCAWGGGGIEVVMTGGDPAGYLLGMAETGTGYETWTGEDCYLGYTAGDGTLYAYCHPLSRSGGFLESVSSFLDIVEGSTTLHAAEYDNTYYLEEVATSTCWVFGHDTSYYARIDCVDIGGGCSGE